MDTYVNRRRKASYGPELYFYSRPAEGDDGESRTTERKASNLCISSTWQFERYAEKKKENNMRWEKKWKQVEIYVSYANSNIFLELS